MDESVGEGKKTGEGEGESRFYKTSSEALMRGVG